MNFDLSDEGRMLQDGLRRFLGDAYDQASRAAAMDTATRLLELLALLHARPVWAGDVLADRLEVTPRTVRRDIARLRSLDYPVESVPGPHGGYRLGRGAELPPLVLDDQEFQQPAPGG